MAALFPQIALTKLINALKQKDAVPFAVQIGAMDGVRFDLLHPHLKAGGWKALLVEPVPDMFALLQKTYAGQDGIQFANVAVTEQSGTIQMRSIDPAAVAANLIPAEAVGISSCAKEGDLLSSEDFARCYPDVVRTYMRYFDVPCLTLADLLTRHGIGHVDLFMIDTEGYDWLIAKQIDCAGLKPSIICLEHSSLKPEAKAECFKHFTSLGYKAGLCEEDQENLVFYKDN